MHPHFAPDTPLHAFTADEVDAIFAASAVRQCVNDETVVTAGTPGDSMFFVVEGTAEARLGDGRPVRHYKPGSYFGELSFINPGHLRSASIVATGNTKLQVLDQTGVDVLIAKHPKAIFKLLRRACVFLVESERELVGDLRRRNDELKDTITRLDVTRRRLSQEEEIARTDGLTGLFNRRAFDAELPNFMDRAKAIGRGLAILAIDLDHFKPVNDTLGHAAGDFVLREVGKILRKQVRQTDLPCRIGGDEFIVLLADLDEAAAKMRADSLCKAIGTFPHPGNEKGIRITTTMGGTLYVAGETVESFMHRADEALYAAKRAGRNRVGWT